jgi:hypothetical protein
MNYHTHTMHRRHDADATHPPDPRPTRSLRTTLELGSKRITFLWTAVAVMAEAALVARGWPSVLMVTGVVALVAAASTAFDRRAVMAVLVCTYVAPAAIYTAHGDWHPFYSVMWFGALLGAMAPEALRKPWRVPHPWRLPIVLWSLVIIAGASIVIARELDFNQALLARDFQPGSTLGGLPPATVTWILHVAVTQLLGILWFDWLLAQGEGILRPVVGSLAVSAAVVMLVAAYQAFGHIEFLNTTVFGATGRASGTLFDGNLAGMIGAMWIGLSVASASLGRRWARSMTVPGIALGWMMVLTSGSRNAQLAGVIVSGSALMLLAMKGNRVAARVVFTRVLPATAVIALVLLVLGARDIGPVGRLWRTLPVATGQDWSAYARELWNRNGYGVASTAMIRDFPSFGIGFASFQTLLPFYAPGLPPDNAQSWYRQLVTELGFVGALAPLLWTVLFAAAVARPAARNSSAAWPLRGVLVASGVVALVGIPAQDLTVALTLWTAAFWYTTVAREAPPTSEPIAMRGWLALLGILAIFSVGTGRLAAGPLRPPVRAERIAWPYSYGFYESERDGEGQPFRWAMPRAVIVLDAPRRVMTLVVRVPHADVAERPVAFRAWVDGREVMNRTISSGDPIVADVRVPDGRPRVRLETWASRSVVPADVGDSTDERRLSAAVSWTFGGDENPSAAPRPEMCSPPCP